MMIVITVSNCPPKLRGDLSKWLIEIDTGVFVGNLTARVRDEVWQRVCANIKHGSATMAYGTNNEQKLDFRVHNNDWEPVDFDGIKLIKQKTKADDKHYKDTSKAKINHINRLAQMKNSTPKSKKDAVSEYVIVDIETTGLDNSSSEIIEIGAVHILNDLVTDQFSALVKCQQPLPREIIELTGITPEELAEKGVSLKEALEKFVAFCGKKDLVAYNIKFDMQFLQAACKNIGLPLLKNKQIDVMLLAKKKLRLKSYRLIAVVENLGIEGVQAHRALEDCLLVYGIYEKLKDK